MTPLQTLVAEAAARGHNATLRPAGPAAQQRWRERAFNIVASQIDIGNALTELSERMTRGVLQAHVLSMTAMASAMPYVGRG